MKKRKLKIRTNPLARLLPRVIDIRPDGVRERIAAHRLPFFFSRGSADRERVESILRTMGIVPRPDPGDPYPCRSGEIRYRCPFVVTLDDEANNPIPIEIRLRKFLKSALRRGGLRCTDIREIPKQPRPAPANAKASPRDD